MRAKKITRGGEFFAKSPNYIGIQVRNYRLFGAAVPSGRIQGFKRYSLPRLAIPRSVVIGTIAVVLSSSRSFSSYS